MKFLNQVIADGFDRVDQVKVLRGGALRSMRGEGDQIVDVAD